MSDLHTAYLGLGTNLGDRMAHLRAAVAQLGERLAVERLSSVYETEPAYYQEQPRFLNMVCRARTALAPEELLGFLKELERRIGRRPSVRFGPRVIDLDILLYGDRTVDLPDLAIPHPRIAERPFVLVPLGEIAPALELPGAGATVAELLRRVGGDGAVVRALGALPGE